MKKQVAGVGFGAALLLVAAACNNTPQSMTSPSATTGGTTAAAGDGSTLKVSPPALIDPVGGVRAEDRRPTFIWSNAVATYGGFGLSYDLEVYGPSSALIYSQIALGETQDFGTHILPTDLDYDATYSWRMRARVGDDVGPWSDAASFVSPSRPVVVTAPPPVVTTTGGGCAAPISPLVAGEVRKPRPNESGIVRGIANQFPASLRNSCQDRGGSWEFVDRVVDGLRAKDGRWGYNAKRGNTNDTSHDVASYYYAGGSNIQGRPEVYIFDFIVDHCGSAPSVGWNDVTDVTSNAGSLGRTIYPRPGRTVAACTAATSK